MAIRIILFYDYISAVYNSRHVVNNPPGNKKIISKQLVLARPWMTK